MAKAKTMAGYGIKVETDTGHKVWLTEGGTSTRRDQALRFDSKAGAHMYRNQLAKTNAHAVLTVEKFSK